MTGCSSNAYENITDNKIQQAPLEKNEIAIDKLEVYHFHGTNQCYSCKTVGAYAEETVNTYFADELKTGKIVFGHINAELPENKDLAIKYGATSASLWLGSYDKTGFRAEQNTNVWYKISNKQDYMNYLKDLIQKRLAGDMT
jgi:hypothetical protein